MSECKVGNRTFYVADRCSLHDAIILQARATGSNYRRCMLCRDATKAKLGTQCTKCLCTDNLDFFDLDEYAPLFIDYKLMIGKEIYEFTADPWSTLHDKIVEKFGCAGCMFEKHRKVRGECTSCIINGRDRYANKK